MKLSVGTRVRHRSVNLTGEIQEVMPNGGYRVKWDHLGLAFSALGVACDFQDDNSIDLLHPEAGTPEHLDDEVGLGLGEIDAGGE